MFEVFVKYSAVFYLIYSKVLVLSLLQGIKTLNSVTWGSVISIIVIWDVQSLRHFVCLSLESVSLTCKYETMLTLTNTLAREYCTVDLLFDLFGISRMTTDNFCFYLQNRLIQTSQTGGQQYSDTSPFSIPCTSLQHYRTNNNDKKFYEISSQECSFL